MSKEEGVSRNKFRRIGFGVMGKEEWVRRNGY